MNVQQEDVGQTHLI